jgi:hypothetical protein
MMQVFFTTGRKSVDRIAIFDSFWNEVREGFHAQGVPNETTLLPRKTHDETDHYRIVSDDRGRLNKELLNEQTTPGPIGFAVENRESWERNYKSLLSYQPGRIEWETFTNRYQALQTKNKYVVLSMLDPFVGTLQKRSPVDRGRNRLLTTDGS